MKALITALVSAVALILVVPATAGATASKTPVPACQATVTAARTLAGTHRYAPDMRPTLGTKDSALVAAILTHPTKAVATSLARQACLSWKIRFGDCLALDLVPVPCEVAAWMVTGVEDATALGEARCATGAVPQVLRGPRAVFCLYPVGDA